MKRKEISKFWSKILSSTDPTSSKRLVTLVVAVFFLIAQLLTIFICFYVIFYTTKGRVDKDLLGMLRDILEYDFYIILSGLGFITAEGAMQVMVEKFRSKRPPSIYDNPINNPMEGDI